MATDDDTIRVVSQGEHPRCGQYELVREIGQGGMGRGLPLMLIAAG